MQLSSDADAVEANLPCWFLLLVLVESPLCINLGVQGQKNSVQRMPSRGRVTMMTCRTIGCKLGCNGLVLVYVSAYGRDRRLETRGAK